MKTSISNLRHAALYVLLLGCTAVTAYAQHPVKGTVTNAKSGDGVAYANIVLLRAADSSFVCGTTCGIDGKFTFADLATALGTTKDSVGLIALIAKVSAIGYKTHFQHIDTNKETLDIQLQEGATTLDAVTITSERPLYANDGEKVLYNVKDDPAMQAGTASDALQNAPGVEVDAQGNITLHGTQSVSIWINGRPSHLTAESLKQYIKTLPANAIDHIEVIQNPSARYGSDGAIVNIVTTVKIKHNQFFSFGGNASLLPSATAWASYVYATEKLSLNAFAYYNIWKCDVDNHGESESRDSTGTLSERDTYESLSSPSNRNFGVYLNGSYTFDTANDLTFWMSVNRENDRFEEAQQRCREEYLYLPGTYHFADTSHTDDNFGAGGNLGIDFTHKFDNNGHKLNLAFNGSIYHSGDHTSTWRHYDRYPAMNFDDRTSTDVATSAWNISADYVRPLGEHWEWELGATASQDYYDKDKERDTLLKSSTAYRCDTLRSFGLMNRVDNVEGYTTLLWRIGNATIKAGIRATYGHYDRSYADEKRYDFTKDFFYLTPSLHFSYSTKDMHNFNASYTLRCQPPTTDHLSNRIFYEIDSYNFGNADLGNAYTHHLTASWTKYHPKFGSVGVEGTYKANTHEIGDLNDVAYCDIFGRIVSYSQSVNIGRSSYGGIDANITYRPIPFANIRLQAGLFNNYYQMQYRPGKWFEQNRWNLRLRLNAWARVWKIIDVFGNLTYNSPTLGLLTEEDYQWGADIGASADLLQRKISIFLFVHNLFDSQRNTTTTLNPYYYSNATHTYNTRVVFFGVSFRFGKMELERMARTGGMGL